MLTIPDYTKYIEIVKNNVDQRWLHRETEKILTYYNTKKNTRILGAIDDSANPLALLIYQAEKQAQNNQSSQIKVVFNELATIVRLGLYIENLQTKNIKGFAEKLTELTTANKDQFEKVLFELDMASAFSKANHKISFIETNSKEQKPTPDLLVDENIEVECKKKDRLTKRDIKNNEHWQFLERKLLELMREQKKFYYVNLFFEEDPTGKSIYEILRKIRKLIINNESGEFSLDVAKLKMYKICDFAEDFLLPIHAKSQHELQAQLTVDILDNVMKERIPNPDLLDYVKQKPDFDVTLPRVTLHPNGEVVLGEIMKFMFKMKQVSDRLKSVINSIKDAKQQLTGNRCSIICVNFTYLAEKMIEHDFARLGEMINDVLGNNSSISAVAVTTESHIRDANGLRFVHQASVIRNKSAKFPLPDDFIIRND
ncbi:MAG TPA: hypothetical protein VGA92_00920 [Candidatus Nitrosotenuis sp.]